MTSTVGLIVQILAVIIQVLNAVNVAGLPTKWQAGFTGLLTIVQAVMGILAHYYTPTGVSITAGTTVTTPEQVGPQPASNSKA
jgi:hypothetical protein